LAGNGVVLLQAILCAGFVLLVVLSYVCLRGVLSQYFSDIPQFVDQSSWVDWDPLRSAY
jgi:hypothetical protein